ncbi:MAG: tRNA (N(6)-L-threonylcarbamoyladenosine(37)-C(2))-methylthiotransferase MtaB [Bacteroidales bacterium]|nr:tRNA (N(6)-L-threonylcarbamoyladenosine(37)-C(2))-methylthiotransferase MtaB [Bacteroidales bacterium]MDY2917504.1 tRNA (N(6)-L-threonylcarbamoyladenosine(37)-C(2))-methylthiotransferase MtaB [Muribaculaceae bacterium]
MTDNSIFTDKTVFYHSFGCKLNFAETSTVAAEFAGAGIRRVAPGEVPDIVVINTCSVTEVADKKCRQAIHSLHRRYPDAAIVVTGCYAQLKTDEVASLPGVAVVAGQDKKDRLLDFLGTWMETHQQQVDVPDFKDIETFIPSCARGDRTRYFLKVQDGCDYWCSYCTIPRARGRSRSGTIASMVEQARKAAAEGGREIVITGVNIGDFGRRTGETFADLVRALDEVEGIERYRISSIEPNLLTDEIIDFCAASKRFMPHFHVPLQCGSDEVLRLMRRRYDTALFRHKMEKIRQAMPDAFIGVDLIVGARGESDELFRESYEFCKSLDISRLHVFVYSERPGTRALELDGAVSPQAKRARSNRMLELSEEKLREFSGRFIGTVRPVLLEHTRPGHPMSGFTDNYLKVEVDAPARLDNTVVNVRLDRLSDDGSFIHATLLP